MVTVLSRRFPKLFFRLDYSIVEAGPPDTRDGFHLWPESCVWYHVVSTLCYCLWCCQWGQSGDLGSESQQVRSCALVSNMHVSMRRFASNNVCVIEWNNEMPSNNRFIQYVSLGQNNHIFCQTDYVYICWRYSNFSEFVLHRK